MMTSLGLKLCLWVMLGGALGAVTRYLLSQFIDHQLVKNPFSLGMLLCNMIGCLLFGWVSAWLSTIPTKTQDASEATVAFFTAFLVSGFLASFTTFSTWINVGTKLTSLDNMMLLKASGYFFVTVLLGVLALVLGSKCYFWFK